MSEEKFVLVPQNDFHWNRVKDYMEVIPDSDYDQAPKQAREMFRDIKYGVRVHWGLYSQWRLPGESWPFLKMTNDKRQEYQELYQKFNPSEFEADSWMRFFKKAGFKIFTITAKHHEGFSLFDTKTTVKKRVNWIADGGPKIEDCNLAYSVMDSPLKRDIIRELCDSARKHDIKIDLYFSHPDWYDADFRPYAMHPLTVPDASSIIPLDEYHEMPLFYGEQTQVVMGKPTKEERLRMVMRHREQLVELLTNYGPIDLVCLDQWFAEDIWTEIKKTIKIARRIQPQVMFRNRGIGNYGDYYTPEGFVPGAKENTKMPWMVIYPLGKTFSYETEEHFKDTSWIIHNLIDTVAKGGNFMIGIGPDEKGWWNPEAIRRLEEVGSWLNINGEGIYATREREGELYKEGNLRFTRSKDLKYTYVFAMTPDASEINLESVRPKPNSKVILLGCDQEMRWEYDGKCMQIKVPNPNELRTKGKNTFNYAYTFKIENG